MNLLGKLLFVQVSFILLSLLPMFSAWENYVPRSKCGSMKPGHGSNRANNPYTISVTDASTNQVTTTYKAGQNIKGMCNENAGALACPQSSLPLILLP